MGPSSAALAGLVRPQPEASESTRTAANSSETSWAREDWEGGEEALWNMGTNRCGPNGEGAILGRRGSVLALAHCPKPTSVGTGHGSVIGGLAKLVRSGTRGLPGQATIFLPGGGQGRSRTFRTPGVCARS